MALIHSVHPTRRGIYRHFSNGCLLEPHKMRFYSLQFCATAPTSAGMTCKQFAPTGILMNCGHYLWCCAISGYSRNETSANYWWNHHMGFRSVACSIHSMRLWCTEEFPHSAKTELVGRPQPCHNMMTVGTRGSDCSHTGYKVELNRFTSCLCELPGSRCSMRCQAVYANTSKEDELQSMSNKMLTGTVANNRTSLKLDSKWNCSMYECNPDKKKEWN